MKFFDAPNFVVFNKFYRKVQERMKSVEKEL